LPAKRKDFVSVLKIPRNEVESVAYSLYVTESFNDEVESSLVIAHTPEKENHFGHEISRIANFIGLRDVIH
jgi:hypothetical protein